MPTKRRRRQIATWSPLVGCVDAREDGRKPITLRWVSPLRGSTHPTSIRNAELAKPKVHEPGRSDQQKLQVLEERRLPALDLVAGKLEHPGGDEHRAGDPLEIDRDVR